MVKDLDVLLRRAKMLTKVIGPILAGKGPEIQGAALADLVSLWVAGHHPELRDGIFEVWIKSVRELIPESEKEILARIGKPEGWP